MSAKIYVGTYGKYNAGSIKGAWLNLKDYSNLSEFHEACKKLHKDEREPEFMYQDWECDAEGLISESWVDERVFDFLALDDHQREIVAIYSQISEDFATALEHAVDRFAGTAETHGDFVFDRVEEMGEINLKALNGLVIDWTASWESAYRFDYDSVRHEGENYYFYTY